MSVTASTAAAQLTVDEGIRIEILEQIEKAITGVTTDSGFIASIDEILTSHRETHSHVVATILKSDKPYILRYNVAKQVSRVVNEFYTTEETYIDGMKNALNFLQDNTQITYRKAKYDLTGLSPKDVAIITEYLGYLQRLVDLNPLDKLGDKNLINICNWINSPEHAFAEKVMCYVYILQKYKDNIKTIADHYDDPLKSAVTQLTGLLVLPIQRMPRYLLLLREIIKHNTNTELNTKLNTAVTTLASYAEKINQFHTSVLKFEDGVSFAAIQLDLNTFMTAALREIDGEIPCYEKMRKFILMINKAENFGDLYSVISQGMQSEIVTLPSGYKNIASFSETVLVKLAEYLKLVRKNIAKAQDIYPAQEKLKQAAVDLELLFQARSDTLRGQRTDSDPDGIMYKIFGIIRSHDTFKQIKNISYSEITPHDFVFLHNLFTQAKLPTVNDKDVISRLDNETLDAVHKLERIFNIAFAAILNETGELNIKKYKLKNILFDKLDELCKSKKFFGQSKVTAKIKAIAELIHRLNKFDTFIQLNDAINVTLKSVGSDTSVKLSSFQQEIAIYITQEQEKLVSTTQKKEHDAKIAVEYVKLQVSDGDKPMQFTQDMAIDLYEAALRIGLGPKLEKYNNSDPDRPEKIHQTFSGLNLIPIKLHCRNLAKGYYLEATKEVVAQIEMLRTKSRQLKKENLHLLNTVSEFINLYLKHDGSGSGRLRDGIKTLNEATKNELGEAKQLYWLCLRDLSGGENITKLRSYITDLESNGKTTSCSKEFIVVLDQLKLALNAKYTSAKKVTAPNKSESSTNMPIPFGYISKDVLERVKLNPISQVKSLATSMVLPGCTPQKGAPYTEQFKEIPTPIPTSGMSP